jgi:hypothetical protein
MNAAEAVDFINRKVAWEPGIQVTASAGWPRYLLAVPSDPRVVAMTIDSLTVAVTINSPDSSNISPEGKYPPPWQHLDTPNASGRRQQSGVGQVIALGEADYQTPERLLYRIIRLVTELHEHESREFTRIRQDDGTWFAPLHPHPADGPREMLWRNDGRPLKEKES